MTLRITGSPAEFDCPVCHGRGSIVEPDTYGVRSSQWTRGGRVPCPKCKGKKTVTESESHVPKM